MITTQFTKPRIHISDASLKLYTCNLGEPIPSVEPTIAVEVAIYDTPCELGSIDAAIVKERVSHGDRIFVASYKKNPVAYLFAATRRCWVEEMCDWLHVATGEVYLYDAFTAAAYRGNRIYSFLLSHAAHFFRKLTYSYALIFSTATNLSSLRGIERVDFRCYGTIRFYDVFGLYVWHYNTRSNGIQSRFSHET